MLPWFCPKPWTTTDIEIDLRPGGIFRSVMRSPEGKEFPNVGCYLEVVPNERLIWTDALLPGYRPAPEPFMTAVLTFEPSGKGTRYVATAIHRDEAGRKRHEEMGFQEGWVRWSTSLWTTSRKRCDGLPSILAALPVEPNHRKSGA